MRVREHLSRNALLSFATADRLRLLKLVLSLALISSFILSVKLWVSSRLYPLTPISRSYPAIPFPLDYVIFAVLLLTLAIVSIRPKPRLAVLLFLALAVGLALGDQTRWQPWFYQYFFMLGALGLSWWTTSDPRADLRALMTCRFIVASIYFWSGFHKLNHTFVDGIFPWLIEPFVGRPTGIPGTVLHVAGFVPPFVEMGLGLGLLARWSRKTSVILILVMHTSILLSLGPLGHNVNSVVWPWNVAMMVSVVLLFWGAEDDRLEVISWRRNGWFHRIVVVLFGCLPVLAPLNFWDSYLSAALYSGNRKSARIYVSTEIQNRLPEGIRRYVRRDASGRNELHFRIWAEKELNVPGYPEVRVFKQVTRAICQYAQEPTEVQLESDERGFWVRKLGAIFLGSEERKTILYDCRDV